MPSTLEHYLGGVGYKFEFENNYSCSVIRHLGSYGQDKGLWESAIIGPNGKLIYHNGDQVQGYLTEDAVYNILDYTSTLDPAPYTDEEPNDTLW